MPAWATVRERRKQGRMPMGHTLPVHSNQAHNQLERMPKHPAQNMQWVVFLLVCKPPKRIQQGRIHLVLERSERMPKHQEVMFQERKKQQLFALTESKRQRCIRWGHIHSALALWVQCSIRPEGMLVPGCNQRPRTPFQGRIALERNPVPEGQKTDPRQRWRLADFELLGWGQTMHFA